MASRPSINANARRAPQDLSQFKGGQMVGRGGNVQTPGAALQRRLAAAPPPATAVQKPAWQQLREGGIDGQGSAAANRAALAAAAGAAPPSEMTRVASVPMAVDTMGPQPGPMVGGGPVQQPGRGGPLSGPMIDQLTSMSGGGLQAPEAGAGGPGGIPLPPPPGAGPTGGPGAPAPSLPPEIMQRLQALQSARFGQPGAAPGAAGPAAGPAKPNFPNYFQGGMGTLAGAGVGPY